MNLYKLTVRTGPHDHNFKVRYQAAENLQQLGSMIKETKYKVVKKLELMSTDFGED